MDDHYLEAQAKTFGESPKINDSSSECLCPESQTQF